MEKRPGGLQSMEVNESSMTEHGAAAAILKKNVLLLFSIYFQFVLFKKPFD